MITSHIKLILFVFLCSFPNLIFAQFGLQKGSIITLQGDTISGRIKNASLQQLSKEIVFQTEQGKRTTYLPKEIKAFFFSDGELFESHHVKVSLKKGNVSEFRFLRLAKTGNLSLYVLDEKRANPLFIKRENEALQLLCISEKGNKEYLYLLKEEIKDCEKLSRLSIRKLQKKGVYKLIKEYNQCTSREADLQNSNLNEIWLWGYTGIPYNYYKNGYNSISWGGYIGGKLPIFRRQVGLEFGTQIYIGENKNQEKKKIADTTVRLRYHFFDESIVTPFLSAGGSFEGVMRKWGYQIGGGLNLNLGRHIFITELSYPYFPNFKIGYGFVIKK